MMIEEFTARTGYKPTFEEYAKIEQQYYDFDGDKDKFCANWCKEARFAEMDAANAISKLLMVEAEKNGIYSPRFLKLKEIFMSINP